MPVTRARAARLWAAVAGVLLLLAGWSAPARAACSLSAATLDLGAASTFDARESRVGSVAGPAGFSCNGAIIVAVSSNRARATAVSAGGFRLRGPGGRTVRYRLSADAAGTLDLSGGAAVDYFDPALLRLLGILSADAFAPALHAALVEAADLPAGTYTDTVTLNWTWQVCHGVGVGGACVLAESGSGSVALTVTLVLTKDCRVTAPDILFGSAPLASGFAAVRQAVTVDCSAGTPFSVAFTSGSGSASRPWRIMTGPGGARLEYNILRPDGAVWDEAVPAAPVLDGAAPGRLLAYVARVNPDQPDPQPGSYTDAVSVVVAF